jgi:hypothetical protein
MKQKLFLVGLVLAFFALNLNAQSVIAWKQATSGGYPYRYVTGDPYPLALLYAKKWFNSNFKPH